MTPYFLPLSTVLVTFSSAVRAQEPATCAGRPEVVAPCFTVHGRLSHENGTPSARIWPVGTHRLLGVYQDELPPEIAARITDFDTELWGDFKVCPISRQRPGHIQSVCVESARNLDVR